MLRYIFAIFSPVNSFKRLIPFLSVLASLSLGIGIFWMVQSLMSNYLDSLIHLVTMSKEEIAIVRNPDREYMTDEELEEEMITGQPLGFAQRMAIPKEKYSDVKNKLSSLIPNGVIQGLVRDFNKEIVFIHDNNARKYKPLIIAAEISAEKRVLPVFDNLTTEEIDAINQKDNGTIYFISSTTLFPSVKKGDVISLKKDNSSEIPIVCAGVVKQHELFAMPLFIVSTDSYEKIFGNVKYNSIAVRTDNPKNIKVVQEIENALGEEYIVNHWSEILKILNSVFNSINIIITIIISSLFIIAFLFSIASFDILIKKRQRHLALLLALGLQPAKIRNGLFCVSGALGVISLIIGTVLAKLFLVIIQYSPLKHMLTQMYFENFSLRFEPYILLALLIMISVVSFGSVAVSVRRIYKIDPIQDLKR